MQFFLYYVFWPTVLGIIFSYTAIMGSADQTWTWLAIWYLPWLTWPIGKFRRRQMKIIVAEFEKESKQAGEVSAFAAASISMGPTLIMILSVWLGTAATPIYMEEVMGIDIQAQIKETQERVQSH